MEEFVTEQYSLLFVSTIYYSLSMLSCLCQFV